MDVNTITQQVASGLNDLQAGAGLQPGQLFVVGCSTSEIAGHCIGTQSNEEIARAVMDAVYPFVLKNGLYLAVQCCEHLNRALVVEHEAMERYAFEQVLVRPWLHAGGAFALQAMERMQAPVLVESVCARAAAGIDIGGTFIGMHLKAVVVPIHSEHKRVGEAVLTMARTRPKYVGGPRAQYDEQR